MNLGSFIGLGMMRGLIHGIQPSPVVFDQIRTSTISKSLSLIYYIINYATKDDISPAQILTKTTLLKMTKHPTATDLRPFNTLANDREISGVPNCQYSPPISRILHHW
jgi:hypothetical protein